MLKVRNLDIGFSQNLLVSRANFQFEKNVIYAIKGDNGIGKTTFLKTLNGFIKPLDGNIFLNELNINKFSIKEKSEIFSTLFSRHEIDSFISVNEIFEFSLGSNFRKNSNHLDFNKTLNYFSITHLFERKFGELSDGQKQIVLIVRALMKKSKIYFLDEPTIYLDLKTKKLLSKFLKDYFFNKNSIVIMISHDQRFIEDTADSIIEIKNGILNSI